MELAYCRVQYYLRWVSRLGDWWNWCLVVSDYRLWAGNGWNWLIVEFSTIFVGFQGCEIGGTGVLSCPITGFGLEMDGTGLLSSSVLFALGFKVGRWVDAA
jgi:hypothetical protein